MFNNSAFSHDTLKKLVIYFGTLFNNIYLNRYDDAGILIQNAKVPLGYGPREKFLARTKGNPDLNREIAIQLPMMSYQMNGFQYDAARARNKLNKITVQSALNPVARDYQYSPVPYDIGFELSIMVKNAEDGAYIVEQILPYFSPSWTATLNINSDMQQSLDVPIYINSVSQTDSYDGSFENRRALIWTLDFTMKAWLFGPTKSGGKIINHIDLGFHIPPVSFSISDAISANTGAEVVMAITPGRAANGTSLNWYGSVNATSHPVSVAANTISSNSNYGFIIDFTSDA